MTLTWDKVDFEAGLIRLNADDVKDKHRRRTPISWELLQVLEELKAERRKVSNIGGRVVTRKNSQPITSIRTAFERAREAARLNQLLCTI